MGLRDTGLIVRPRFGRPCFDCGDTVPTQRLDALVMQAAQEGRALLKSERLCVRCAAKVASDVSVTRKPRR